MAERQERKLASIRVVNSVAPIANSDFLSVVHVDGWMVVAKRGEFNAGDRGVFFEIDSFLPVTERFEYLRKACFVTHPELGEGFRLKTVKLRGQISQGLILPLSEFPELPADIAEGTDVTAALGVRKYEVPEAQPGVWRAPSGAQAAKTFMPFPHFVRRTDQERIQNCFREIAADPARLGAKYEVTMKLDGTSTTIYMREGVFGVCSRNYQLRPAEEGEPESPYWLIAQRMGLEERMRRVGRNVAVQGELLGPKIGVNREKLPDLKLFVFDVFDIDRQTYMAAPDRMEVLRALNEGMPEPLQLAHVPILEEAMPLTAFKTVDDFLQYADRPSLRHAIAEGVVFKCVAMPNLSFKAINNRYLLKCEE